MAVDIIIMYCQPKFLRGEFFAKFLRGIFCNVHGFLAISKVYNILMQYQRMHVLEFF